MSAKALKLKEKAVGDMSARMDRESETARGGKPIGVNIKYFVL
jgi:hypothetical protein